jgi:XRE family transcriptional regulator, fatty acid utilization regulator
LRRNKDSLKFILGLKLKDLRAKKGLSLKELASMSGLSSSYLNEIEKGKKYPKVEKLLSLARGLKVSLDDLTSVRISKKLKPILEFIESDLYNRLPLDAFGLTDQDLFELMSGAPEKFSSFIMALQGLARFHDFSMDKFHKIALRSYKELNGNYFPEIETIARVTRSQYFNETPLSIEGLKKVLEEKFHYNIDTTTLGEDSTLTKLRSLYKEGPPHHLLLGGNLKDSHILFILAKELGSCVMGLPKTVLGGKNLYDQTFNEILSDYKSSYFSGSLLINENELAADMRGFFGNSDFNGQDLLKIKAKYAAGTEVFMQRLTQILPTHFGLDQLFFLKFNNPFLSSNPNKITLSQEIHLGGVHNPHGVEQNEHYCRRWITVALLNELAKGDNRERTHIVEAQKSIMIENGSTYFCISVAMPSKRKDDMNSCVTIGMRCNEQFQNSAKFWNSSEVRTKEVSQTCERCPITDCDDRACAPSIYLESQSDKQIKEKITSLLNLL